MTEKNYGGAAPFRKQIKEAKAGSNLEFSEKNDKSRKEVTNESLDKQKVLKAGHITSEIRDYVKEIVKKDMLLIDLAEKIERRIIQLGGKPAFPVNLSIDDVAAHYTPAFDDQTKAHGLLKVDFGVHVDGWVADTSLSFDLEDNEENRKLILAAEKALDNALKLVKEGAHINEIGKEIQKTMESYKAFPITNLTGHSITHYELHAGTSIPNYNSGMKEKFEEGIYAIEPFATFGNGRIYDGKPSGIYELVNERNVRSPIARKILDFVIDKYSTLPFCSRWIVKEFGQGALFGLKQLEDNGNLHQFSQLVEVSHRNVAQAEHTVLIEKNRTEVTTK
jgi:methionyl aminopeptidase